MQQILLHREMGIPLADIAAIINAPGFDRLAALRSQRERVNHEARRYARLVATIDRTIAAMQGDATMTNAELYAGVSPDKQAEYEAWLIDRFGGDMPERIADSRKSYEILTADEQRAIMDELKALEDALAEGLLRGVPMGSPSLDVLLKRHREWVARMWNRPCPPEAYAGLADLYLSHPDFVARYEAIEPGLAEYLSGTMKVHAHRIGA